MRRSSCLLELSSSRQSDLVSVYHSYLESVGGIAHASQTRAQPIWPIPGVTTGAHTGVNASMQWASIRLSGVAGSAYCNTGCALHSVLQWICNGYVMDDGVQERAKRRSRYGGRRVHTVGLRGDLADGAPRSCDALGYPPGCCSGPVRAAAISRAALLGRRELSGRLSWVGPVRL